VIRLTVPSIDEDDLKAVRDVLESGFLVQGPRVSEFEQGIANYVGTTYAVAVSNCTAALHLSLLAIGVGPGDWVAVPTYSWPATVNVVALCGAKPVFIDIEPDTFNMSPAALETSLSTQRVKAVIPVHTFGGIADMKRINAIAAKYGAIVIEDAACAIGASLSERAAGTWGTMGCFSFHPRKAITTGEGGMITTNDPQLVKSLRALRNHGQDPDAPRPDFILPGYNLRLTEFQAALGLTQLKKLDRIIASRQALVQTYNSLLDGTELRRPSLLPESNHVYQSYVVLLPGEIALKRSEIIAELKSRGVETTIGTYHLPMTTYFRQQGGYKRGDFLVADDIAERALTLPLYDGLTTADQKLVISELLEVLAAKSATVAI
jgi:perosamine synthetase